MTDFKQYRETRELINNIIQDKENEILAIEKEITTLKQTRRMLDEEQQRRQQKSDPSIG